MAPKQNTRNGWRRDAASRSTPSPISKSKSSHDHALDHMFGNENENPAKTTRDPHENTGPHKKKNKKNHIESSDVEGGISPYGSTRSDASGGEGKGKEEEEGEKDDGDEPEGFAPSEHTITSKGNQTGLARSALAGLKRHLRSSENDSKLEDDDKAERRPNKIMKQSHHINDDAFDKSDEEDYNAVDLISDSADEDEPNLEQAEEKLIIDSEEESERNSGSPKIPTSPRSDSSDEWHGLEVDGGLYLDDMPFFDEQIGRSEPSLLATDIDVFDSTFLEGDAASSGPVTTRRVRFVDDLRTASASSSNSTTSADDNAFPDLFMQQDRLDPQFRSLIENDDDADNGRSLSDGEWDLTHNEDFELERHGLEEDYSGTSCGSSSGYETDEGETTDEEILPPATITCPQSLLRVDSFSDNDATRTPKNTPVRRSAPSPASKFRGPSMGSWVADPTKPIAVIDSTGKHMVIYPAQRPSKINQLFSNNASCSSSTTTSPRNSFAALTNAFDDSENDRSDFGQDHPGLMLAKGANMMMPGLLHGGPGVEHILGGQVMGPPEAFYPFKSVGADGRVLEESQDDSGDDDDDEALCLTDFIDFGDDSESEKDVPLTTTPTSPTQPTMTESTGSRARANSGDSSTQDLLEHFDRGVVTAFRRNQTRHQTLLRRPPIDTSKSGSHGIKGGRHRAANAPISPMRKRRNSASVMKAGAHMGMGRPAAIKRRLSGSYKRN